ncbi:hypothetical protein G6F22_021204 [Rhizopus arrhizus]|nr:hypothetical protein G6F22_021204 [Rhizopus arrhizus]
MHGRANQRLAPTDQVRLIPRWRRRAARDRRPHAHAHCRCCAVNRRRRYRRRTPAGMGPCGGHQGTAPRPGARPTHAGCGSPARGPVPSAQ